MMTKVFWTAAILDAVAAVILWKLFERGTHGLLIALYLIVLFTIGLTLVIFPFLRSDGWRLAALIFLFVPSVPLVFYSAAAAVNTIRTERRFSGSAYFQGPALELAQAMVRGDTGLVKQLLPAAGDLNQPHGGGGVTLWQFGVLQANDSEPSIDMLRALLAAGADPRRDTSADTLLHAIARGPGLTRFLLEAGSNPNLLDHEHRPLWWSTMGPGEDDADTELLRLMLDHGADLNLRAPDGRGPVGKAVAARYWYAACLLVERGADWKTEKVRGRQVPDLLEWEIIRREEYPIPVREKMRKVLAGMRGGEPRMMAPPVAGGVKIPDLLNETSFDKLEENRAALSRLAQQRPDWVRRVEAFFEDGDGTRRNQVALLLSLKPEALPEDVQDRCWSILREQLNWYVESAAAYPKERKGWLLKETAVIAVGLASIPGPIRDRHRADFTALRDRIEECRKASDPDASKLADLTKADWTTAP